MSDQQKPTGLKGTKGIELLTFKTPNGHKASIILEELKAAYGLDYTFQSIDISQNIQKEPWFTKLGPNGRIPVIVDHERNGFAVQEGLAILQYLTRHYDPEHRFNFEDPDDFSLAEQWTAWQHGGLGPMQGQANHFHRLAKVAVPYAKQRYVGETERLFGILDAQLQGRDYLVGPGKGKYSIADIANFSWVNFGYFSGIDVKSFKNLWAWAQRIEQRPAVQAGLNVPAPSQSINSTYLKSLESDQEAAAKHKDLHEQLSKAKEEFNYKYASP